MVRLLTLADCFKQFLGATQSLFLPREKHVFTQPLWGGIDAMCGDQVVSDP